MIKIYNTMSGTLQEFTPVNPGVVNMYVCGPTVYNYIHIGNARPIIFFDTVKRYFEYIGYKVNYIQNFTDIDDKMIKKANEEGISVKELADKFITEYFKDTKTLNIKEEGAIHPKATENIEEMIDVVKTLEAKGFAYESEGDVYFDIEKFEEYGKLSHRNIEDMMAGARIEISEKKKNPMDFVLWKNAKPGEPSWNSPWGEGRPGWHLECSAMSAKYLGDTFDIHGGGQDLIFPHHENEIAQSECASGKTFANYWMHNGYINIKGEKMSKSTGNFFLLREVLEKYPGNILRFFMIMSHYRKPIEFSEDELMMAKSSLERIENSVRRVDEILTKSGSDNNGTEELLESVKKSREKFCEGMNDDFNTSLAIGAIFDMVKEINRYIDMNPIPSENAKEALISSKKIVKNIMEDVLGVKLSTENVVKSGITSELIDFIVELRWDAKQNKNWAMSDKIRDRLKEMGIDIKDGKDGTTWKM
jgi:cysteinyl-tRNA synthetase